ncbi:xanthine dehydrogenase family protein subunit M [bacterium]|nr:xanthine dehydrogenase family protein subunit M [bacterium]
MQTFAYGRATTADVALATLAEQPRGAFLAGGTSLLDLMKLGVETPDVLIDISRLAETALLDQRGGMRLGALARNSDVAADARVQARYPMLAEAILSGASPQLRHMATLGGNLLQRTRCLYFRDTHAPCGKRTPGESCSAKEGTHRSHAILGTSEACFATHPSDMAVALVALEAIIVVRGPQGERRIPIDEFYLQPGATPHRETVLAHGEFIVALELPALSFGEGSRYLKVRDRATYEFALASAAVALDVQDGRIHQARVALGGVGTVPWRARAAEAALTGAPATTEAFERAAQAELASASPRRDNRFKVALARKTLVRALSEVAASKGGRA